MELVSVFVVSQCGLPKYFLEDTHSFSLLVTCVKLEKDGGSGLKPQTESGVSGLRKVSGWRNPLEPGSVLEVCGGTVPGCSTHSPANMCETVSVVLASAQLTWIVRICAKLFNLLLDVRVSRVSAGGRIHLPLEWTAEAPLLLPTSTCWARTAIYSRITSPCSVFTLQKIDDELGTVLFYMCCWMSFNGFMWPMIIELDLLLFKNPWTHSEYILNYLWFRT